MNLTPIHGYAFALIAITNWGSRKDSPVRSPRLPLSITYQTPSIHESQKLSRRASPLEHKQSFTGVYKIEQLLNKSTYSAMYCITKVKANGQLN